jgi:hypothetical protein
MTSFLIKAHENRAPSPWNGYQDCAFCRIIRDEIPSTRVFENDMVIAILGLFSGKPVQNSLSNYSDRYSALEKRTHPSHSQGSFPSAF